MTAPAPPHACQWCQHPLTPANTRWWDNQPQCANPHACTNRITRSKP
jgi:hypothetical protein